jgi:predicted nucleic acid-binding protein
MNGMKNKLVGLDTNVFIYYFQQHPQLGESAKHIFSQLVAHKTKAVTSTITMIEMLSFKESEAESIQLRDFLLEIPNLTISDVTGEVSVEAARIRRTYGFRLPDAVQLATCLLQKVDLFITNDRGLKTFKELPIVFLEK